MKKFIYVLILTSSILFTGCFEEYDGEISPGQQWIYFENSTLRVNEDASGAVSTTIFLSGAAQASDVTIPFVITSDELVEGTDYTVASSEIVIPAGKHSATADLLSSIIDNDAAVGDRSLTVTLQDINGFEAGFPGPDGNNASIVVTIAEDDFTIFAETSFEEPDAPDDDIFYTRSGTTEMNNNVGDPIVDYVSTGSELGFDSSFAADDFEGGETGGERIGVVSNTAFAAASDANIETTFQRGEQGYIGSDMDGRIEVVFDDVTIPAGASTVVVEITFYVNAGGGNIETEDALEIFWETETGGSDPIASYRGNDDTGVVTDLNGNPVQGQWITDVIELPSDQAIDGNFKMTIRSGANGELFMVDYLAIKGIL